MKDIQANRLALTRGLGARTRSQAISERDTLRRTGLLIYVDQRLDTSSMYSARRKGIVVTLGAQFNLTGLRLFGLICGSQSERSHVRTLERRSPQIAFNQRQLLRGLRLTQLPFH